MQKHTVISTGKFYKGVTNDLKSPIRKGKSCLTYEVGAVVVADGLDEDPHQGCGKGINFCRTLAEALRFGPVVLEVSVPARTKIIDTGGKLRAAKVKVEARANLAGAYLADANLARANLARANLARANLADANLADANLARAYLARANLARANLARAYLADANLARAYLARANLARANLARAYLADANLARANLADAYLAGARGNQYTQLPSGWKVNESGLIVRIK